MKILYIARHDQTLTSNDDEGAVHHALEVLGHSVYRVHEVTADKVEKRKWWPDGLDFVLFHKYGNWDLLRAIDAPKVFWYFDLVDYPDPRLKQRCLQRRNWMHSAMSICHTGFCTDGDWAAKHPDKLVWLTQGFDERQVNLPILPNLASYLGGDILFVGSRNGGAGRESFVDEMHRRWGSRFVHIPNGFYKQMLRRLILNFKVVVAPHAPCTDRYWSNRVYLTLGHGGCLVHPLSEGLTREYEWYLNGGSSMLMYDRPETLHSIVNVLLNSEADRSYLSKNGRSVTIDRHLYRHRCERMIKVLKERGL